MIQMKETITACSQTRQKQLPEVSMTSTEDALSPFETFSAISFSLSSGEINADHLLTSFHSAAPLLPLMLLTCLASTAKEPMAMSRASRRGCP